VLADVVPCPPAPPAPPPPPIPEEVAPVVLATVDALVVAVALALALD
jgi:hypothetical protein